MINKKWTAYAEEYMDRFIETGEPEHLEAFLDKFFCEECRNECDTCAAYSTASTCSQLRLSPPKRILRGNIYRTDGVCSIVHCLNSCLDTKSYSRFDFVPTVGNMSTIRLRAHADYRLKPTFNDMMSKFNHAKFLFMFIPVWEIMKEECEGKK